MRHWKIPAVLFFSLSFVLAPSQAWPAHPKTNIGLTRGDIATRSKALSDDAFAGRGPGTPQGEAAAQWIAETLARLGIAPANHGSYFQRVPVVEIRVEQGASSFGFHSRRGDIGPVFGRDVLYQTDRYDKSEVKLKHSPVVFVGYGLSAPAVGRDDYAGVSVRGKTVVMLCGLPGNLQAKAETAPGLKWYGKSRYKFAEAARHGAAAVLLIHESQQASLSWAARTRAYSGPYLRRMTKDKNADRPAVQGWLRQKTAEVLFARAQMSFPAMKTAAEKTDFHAVLLRGVQLYADLHLKRAERISRNVIGILHGSRHPEDKVLLSANWDGPGVCGSAPAVSKKDPDRDVKKTAQPPENRICHGAVVNALSVSMVLDMAESFTHAGSRPKRSVVFFFPTWSEQGALGTDYFVRHPLWPLKHIVGVFSLTGELPAPALADMSAPGPAADGLQGYLVRSLKKQGRTLTVAPENIFGPFMAPENPAFARAGVPVIMPQSGINALNGGHTAANSLRRKYFLKHYNQSTDEYDATWNLTNPLADEQAVYDAAAALANTGAWPQWNPASPFRAARDSMMTRAEPGHPVTSGDFSAADIRARDKALSDDFFLGRAPGTEEGEKAADWIAEELKRSGVAPGARGSYFQKVPTADVTLDKLQSDLEIHTAHGTIHPEFPKAAVYWTPHYAAREISLADVPVVFAGYGVVAPEYDWDDYAGVDVKGKAVMVLVNDPGFAANDPALFGGKAMTYYGRWTYKLEEAARHGAAAVLIVHETEPASYGWNVVESSNAGRHSWLIAQDHNNSMAAIEGWVSLETATEIFRHAGMTFAAAKTAAGQKGFHAVELPGESLSVKASSVVAYHETRNVIGMIRGRKRPGEVVMYSAHWDHLGVLPDSDGADKICNGAIDNAMGVSMGLEMAEKFAHAPQPERSVVFLFTTLEEQGLLGSEYFVRHPLWQLKHIVGDINLDGARPSAGTRDMTLAGSGQNALEAMLGEVLKKHGRHLTPDPHPEAGSYFRADHFSFARAGVPSISPEAGTDWLEGGVAAGEADEADYRARRYHQPADEYDPAWDFTGPLQDTEIFYQLGRALADSAQWPEWNAESAFRARREKMRARP